MVKEEVLQFDIDKVKFDEKGLVPCIVQDYLTHRVLTLAYMNRESLKITLEKGLTCFFSRSRQELWLKGATSGNYQHIVSMEADCDRDAILVQVVKDGPACHLGNDSCFDHSLTKTWPENAPELVDVYNGQKQPTGRVVSRKARLEKGQYMMYVLALLETPDHRFLITRRALDKKWAAGAWEIPGGAGRHGESSYDAVCREVLEETGLDLRNQPASASISGSSHPEPVYSYFNEDLARGDNYFVDIYHFRFPFTEKDVTIEASEAIDHAFATMAEITAMDEKQAFLHYRRIQEALRKEQTTTVSAEKPLAAVKTPPANFHMHSLYCDGKNTISEMAQAAYEKSFTLIGFSGHMDPGVHMKDLAGYVRDVAEVQSRYAGVMQVFLGLELDNACNKKNLPAVEYTIGSTHFIPVPGSPVWNRPADLESCQETNPEFDLIGVDNTVEILRDGCRKYYQGDFYRMAADYFRFESMVTERLQPTFIGHFDLITRFNDLPEEEGGHYLDEEDPRYLKPAYEALEKLAAYGIPFEVNLGAMNRGRKKHPYPAPALMKKLYTLHAELVLSSDAHDCDHIDGGFSEGAAYIRSFGFDHVNVLTRVKTGRPAKNTAQARKYLSCDAVSTPLYWREIPL